jgi:hypothetical protein
LYNARIRKDVPVLFRLGIVAIIASFLPWLAIALAPLMGLSLTGAAGVVGAAVLTAELLFWTGLALAGRDTWRAIKADGWRRAPRALARLLARGRPRSARV